MALYKTVRKKVNRAIRLLRWVPNVALVTAVALSVGRDNVEVLKIFDSDDFVLAASDSGRVSTGRTTAPYPLIQAWSGGLSDRGDVQVIRANILTMNESKIRDADVLTMRQLYEQVRSVYWTYDPERQVACYFLNRTEQTTSREYRLSDILRYRCISLVGSVSEMVHIFEWTPHDLRQYSAQVDRLREVFWESKRGEAASLLGEMTVKLGDEEPLSQPAARAHWVLRRLQETAMASARDLLMRTVMLLVIVSVICHSLFLTRFMRGMVWVGWRTLAYGAYFYYVRLGTRRELRERLQEMFRQLKQSDRERQQKTEEAQRQGRIDSRTRILEVIAASRSTRLRQMIEVQVETSGSIDDMQNFAARLRNLEHRAELLGATDNLLATVDTERAWTIDMRLNAGESFLGLIEFRNRLEKEWLSRQNQLQRLKERVDLVQVLDPNLSNLHEAACAEIDTPRQFRKAVHNLERALARAEEKHERSKRRTRKA